MGQLVLLAGMGACLGVLGCAANPAVKGPFAGREFSDTPPELHKFVWSIADNQQHASLVRNATFILNAHVRIHERWVDGALPGLAASDSKLAVRLEIVVGSGGIVERAMVVRSSGVSAFDRAAANAATSAGPFDPPPADAIAPRDGKVHLRWTLHRDERQCSPVFAWLTFGEETSATTPPETLSDAERKPLIHRYFSEDVWPPIFFYDRYPVAAQRAGIEGTVIVRLTIARTGELVATKIIGSCVNTILCSAALATAEKAAPFPPPPIGMAVSVDVKFRYGLE